MANVDGAWDVAVKSPMGEQKGVLTIASDNGAFTGNMTGAMGELLVEDGKIEGDQLSWIVKIKVPMPMTLTYKATVEGDTMTGTAGAGVFGKFPVTATRAA